MTGTAISVYCILLNTVPNTDTTTALTFTLDGVSSDPFLHTPDSSSTVLYNSRVYSKSGLENVAHTLVVSPIISQGRPSLVLFDYAEYSCVRSRHHSTCLLLTNVS
jgi:hypothetical protein